PADPYVPSPQPGTGEWNDARGARCLSHRHHHQDSAPADRLQGHHAVWKRHLPDEALTKTFRESNRPGVLGMNEADGALPSKSVECMPKRGTSSLEGEASAPIWSRERPRHLAIGPALRVVEANSPDEPASAPLLDRPHPE